MSVVRILIFLYLAVCGVFGLSGCGYIVGDRGFDVHFGISPVTTVDNHAGFDNKRIPK